MVYAARADVLAYTQVEAGDLGLTTSEFESLVDDLRERASARIDALCGRDFGLHTAETLTLRGGKRMLNLPNPVHEVSEVREHGELVPADDYVWRPSGSLIRKGRTLGPPIASGVPPGPSSNGKREWADGPDAVAVDLTYGYHPPASVRLENDDTATTEDDLDPIDGPTLPLDIQEATVRLVDNVLVGQLSKREATTLTVDDYRVEANLPTAITGEIKEMLSPHADRRVF